MPLPQVGLHAPVLHASQEAALLCCADQDRCLGDATARCARAVEICKYKSPHGGETVVAVKRLRHNMLKNKEELANFVEECKLLRKLSNRCWSFPVVPMKCIAFLATAMPSCSTRSRSCWLYRVPTILKQPRLLLRSRVTRYLGMGSVEGSEDQTATQAVLDSTYLVQEYIDGGTLRDQVLKQARMHSYPAQQMHAA